MESYGAKSLFRTGTGAGADRSADHIDPRLFGNLSLSLSMMMVYKAIPNTMPFLFPELAEDMVEFQINALLDAMQRAKESGNRVKEDVQK